MSAAGLAYERADLLSKLEHRCVTPGEWLVEGFRVSGPAGRNRCWEVRDGDGRRYWAPRFTDCLRWIADEVAR